jgi:RND family efflux transporter MFP subunit
VIQDFQEATNSSSDLSSLRIDRVANSRHARRRQFGVGLLFAIAAAAAGYFARGRITAQEVETIHPTVKRSTATQAVPILSASGYLVARRKGVVSAKIQGRLAALNVEEGSWVTAGQVIARLDNTDFQAQIDVARAGVQQAATDLAEKQRQLRLTQDLANAGVISQDQLQAAASRVRMAEAALSQSKANLSLSEANFENTIIRAPFAGVVVKKMAEVGESVAPIPPGVNLSTSSGAIVGMADMATLEAEADVSESNIAKLQRNQPAQVQVDASPDHIYRAVLRQVIPTADRTKATIAVKVRLLEKRENLRPEMSAKITFLKRARESSRLVGPIITVPKDALVARDGGTAVFVVDGLKKIHLVSVSIGRESSEGVILEHGLAGTETLVRHPPSTLKDGDTVKSKNEEKHA